MKQIDRSYLMLSGIILLAFVFTIGNGIAQDNRASDDKPKEIVEDIKPYDGSIGPTSALYGLKIAFEDLGEGFTFNETEKIEKQIEHAGLRIAEARAELRDKNDDAANRALERFREKLQEVDNRVSGIKKNDSGILEAQRSIVKHQFVLEHLLEDNPNNTGLERALNNSLELEDKFASKTDLIVVPVISRDQVILRDVKRERLREIERESVQVEAKNVGNDTEIRVRVKLISNNTDRDAIAKEILGKLQLNKTEIEDLLEIEVVDFEELRESLEAKAKVGRGISEVEAEFRFPLLKTTNRTDIVNGTAQKFLTLNETRIKEALEFKVNERREIREINENEKVEIKAKIIGNSTKSEVRVEFVSNNTDINAIAQEILDKLQLSKEAISNLLEIEIVPGEELKERQKANLSIGQIIDIRREDRREQEAERGGAGEAERGDVRREDRGIRASLLNEVRFREVEAGDDRGREAQAGDVRQEDRREDRVDRHSEIGVGNNFSEVEFELEFPLNTTNRTEIVDGIFQKLSTLTVQDILNSLEKAREEIKQKKEERREQEIKREQEARHEQEAERGGAGEAERRGAGEAERGGERSGGSGGSSGSGSSGGGSSGSSNSGGGSSGGK